MTKWIDITQTLANDIAVWPGDTPFSFEVACTKEESGSVNIGKVTMSTHTGTHIDAPFHFDNDGAKVHELDIDVYVGRARIVDVGPVAVVDAALLAQFELTAIERLLIKTNAHGKEKQFPTAIPVIAADVGPFLRERGIRLLGVDVPSVDALDSKELAAHHALGANGVHILENVVLTDVAAGDYELVALPLKLAGADGSPVRAIIRPVEA